MPLEWLVDYWQAKAELTLPFLKGRATGMQLVFGNKVIFQRHEPDGTFVVIDDRAELLKWARQHCYSFHPHLEDGVLVFALDIDRRHEAMPFDLAQYAAGEMSGLLTDLAVAHLLKFSGKRGFHFFWGFARTDLEVASGGDIWEFCRATIRYLRDHLEERLRRGPRHEEFYRVLPANGPITITNSADREHERSLLLDENIVHAMGSLRSPWSVHPESGLVSLPLVPEELADFRPEEATPSNVLDRGGPTELPQLSVARWQKLLSG